MKLLFALNDVSDKIAHVQAYAMKIAAMCRLVYLVFEIQLLHGLRNPFCDCWECGQEKVCWNECVDYFFNYVFENANNENYIKLAEKYCLSMRETLIRPSVEDINTIELKEQVREYKTIQDDLFKKIYDYRMNMRDK